MIKYETFSTTADVGIRVSGNGYTEFFQAAIRGLNLLYFSDPFEPVKSFPASLVYPFEYEGDSLANILVNFLSEIVFLVQYKQQTIIDVDLHVINETHLSCSLLNIPSPGQPELEIKSVTYHNLEVVEKDGILSTEVIFDV